MQIHDYFDEPSESLLPDLTPLIDVIFILIVFFLLTPSIKERSIDVDLPSASASSTVLRTENETVIEVDRNNALYFEGEKTDINSIRVILSDRESVNQGNKIMVRSDKESSFGAIIELMDVIKESGFDAVSFSVVEAD